VCENPSPMVKEASRTNCDTLISRPARDRFPCRTLPPVVQFSTKITASSGFFPAPVTKRFNVSAKVGRMMDFGGDGDNKEPEWEICSADSQLCWIMDEVWTGNVVAVSRTRQVRRRFWFWIAGNCRLPKSYRYEVGAVARRIIDPNLFTLSVPAGGRWSYGHRIKKELPSPSPHLRKRVIGLFVLGLSLRQRCKPFLPMLHRS